MSASRWVGCLLSLILLFTAGSVQAAPIVVDNLTELFTGGNASGGAQLSADNNNTDVSNTQGPSANFIGLRTGSVTNTGPGIISSTDMAISAGILAFSTGTLSTAGTGYLLYDTTPGVNLAAGGTIDFNFGTFNLGTDLNPLTLSVTLADTSTSQQVFAPPISSTGLVQIPLSSFNAVDKTNIQSIRIDFSTTGRGIDFSLNNQGGGIIIQEIPEPASIALWGVLGIAGAWYARRRFTTKATA